MHRTKPQLALEIVRRSRQRGVRFAWVGGDEVYGSNPELTDALEDMGETFLMDVRSVLQLYESDPRLPLPWVTNLLARATERGLTVVGITKHTSLSRGGAPLIGQLEREADATLGPRTRWWASIGHSVAERGVPFTVVAARLDPDAPYSFRLDIAAGNDPEVAIAQVACVSDDAAFPGYPYPLTVADRLAACPPWIREEAWLQLQDRLYVAGVPSDVLERAFADRHRLMERAS